MSSSGRNGQMLEPGFITLGQLETLFTFQSMFMLKYYRWLYPLLEK
jgi:hypothetical protein